MNISVASDTLFLVAYARNLEIFLHSLNSPLPIIHQVLFLLLDISTIHPCISSLHHLLLRILHQPLGVSQFHSPPPPPPPPPVALSQQLSLPGFHIFCPLWQNTLLTSFTRLMPMHSSGLNWNVSSSGCLHLPCGLGTFFSCPSTDYIPYHTSHLIRALTYLTHICKDLVDLLPNGYLMTQWIYEQMSQWMGGWRCRVIKDHGKVGKEVSLGAPSGNLGGCSDDRWGWRSKQGLELGWPCVFGYCLVGSSILFSLEQTLTLDMDLPSLYAVRLSKLPSMDF